MSDENKPETTAEPDLSHSMIEKFGASVAGIKRADDMVLVSGDQSRKARLYMKSRGPLCREGEEILGKIVDVTDIIVVEATNVDRETGVERQYPRTTLFNSKGECWRFGSQYVFESVIQLRCQFGDPTPQAPWFVVPVRSKTRKGQQMISLTLPEPDELDAFLGVVKTVEKKPDLPEVPKAGGKDLIDKSKKQGGKLAEDAKA